jgi:hypothetical protein
MCGHIRRVYTVLANPIYEDTSGEYIRAGIRGDINERAAAMSYMHSNIQGS